jgi:unsaturated rhamnogalacturonyl hydrolase
MYLEDCAMNLQLMEKVKTAMLAMQRHSWEQGVAATALIETGDEETALLLAHDAIVNQTEDGRLALVGGNNGVADPAANYGPVLHAARKTGDPAFFEAADKMRDYLLNNAPRTSDGLVSHVNNTVEIWSDSFFMLPPFFADAGLLNEAVQHIEGYRKILFDTEKQLYHHIWNDSQGKFEHAAFWGGGNGWAAAGIARVLTKLPASMEKERKLLCSRLDEIIGSCVGYMRPDGLFHDILDNPESFVETNLSQMLAYAIYIGVANGWLDNKYLSDANRMRAAALQKIDGNGLVHGVCGAPTFSSPGTSTEAQAFTLLMEVSAGYAGII